MTLRRLALAGCLMLAAAPLPAQAAGKREEAVRLVANYLGQARLGADVTGLVHDQASVNVIGVGAPYVHAEFVTYFQNCATEFLSGGDRVKGFRQMHALGELRYVIGGFVCRDGDVVEPLARIGFGVQSAKITRIDLNPDLFLVDNKEDLK